ncbi:unnamed protein product [Acanthoscelides obtectus]|uniref:Uncharacterized protein n=1 Tax=Acanthoscelides obtectus TaxID=200917 RepID=A0A9P0K0S6_ACAOB|nr:unnamed protein product [Acanthoscelides obtectus]CAK1658447.1 hypothetical protein AOBTE_LOCUS20899 [Acanthoscelides obtectus]
MTKRQDISSRRSRDEKLRDKEQEQLLKALQTSIDDYSSYQKSTCFQNYSDFLTVFSSWQCPYGWHKIVQDKVTLFKLEYKPAPIITHSVIVDKDLNVKTYMYSQELLLNSGNIKLHFYYLIYTTWMMFCMFFLRMQMLRGNIQVKTSSEPLSTMLAIF